MMFQENISSSEWNDLNVDVATLRRDTANIYQKILTLSEVMLKQESFMKELDLEKTETNQNNSDEGSTKTSRTEKTYQSSAFKPKVKLTLKEFTLKADTIIPTHINQVLPSFRDLGAIQ